MFIGRPWAIAASLLLSFATQAQEASQILPNPNGFEMTLWAREPMLKNPVALSFDDLGRLFVVETARRGTVDIDIRAHRDWAYDDLRNQSIAQLRLFFRDKMAPERSEANARWLQDRNQDGVHDWRDLTTIKERVYRIEDTDHDGVADKSQVFYEGFNEEFNGVIAGVMPWKEDVWVTVYPDLWRFHDRDDDGIADAESSRVRGFGVHAAYDGHDLHGLTLGPEGKLYFSVGDNGFSFDTLEGRRIHYPNTGGVLRMNPDGSDLEVFAYGLRNVQEIAFDDYGNLFAVDNDGDIEDERERFVYITEGSDSGWRLNWQLRTRGWTQHMGQPYYNPWVHEKMWIPYFKDQPAHITPALSNYSVGPGGFRYNPGTALNASYKGYFFLAQFPVQKISAFRVKPDGAAFEMVDEHTFHFGLMASAMNFGPDGAMYIADWDGKWQPNDKGAIHRLDDPKMRNDPVRREVQRLFNEGFAARSLNELEALLGHADQRIRQRAQGELASRNEGERLLSIARSVNRPQLARIHALWGLIEMGGDEVGQLAARLPFADPDTEIRAQAAKVAGDLRLKESSHALRRLLRDGSSLRTQAYAATALGKLHDPAARDDLVDIAVQNAGADPFLRHALVMGLVGCGSSPALVALTQHTSEEARLVAVLALRRLKSPLVAEFLNDSSPQVVTEAVRAIHDDFSIVESLPGLATLDLSERFSENEPLFRRVLNANLRLGRPSNANRLAELAMNTALPSAIRGEAVECLRVWNGRPYLDRVEGRARHLGPRQAGLGDQLLETHALELLQGADQDLAQTVTRALRQNGLTIRQDILFRTLEDPRQSDELRSEALRLITQQTAVDAPRAIDFALKTSSPLLRLNALELESRINAAKSLSRFNQLADYSLLEQQLLISTLGESSTGNAIERLSSLLANWLRGTLADGLKLDVLQAAQQNKDSTVQAALEKVNRSLETPIGETDYRFSLEGGNRRRGQQVYETHVAAQCIRCHNAGGLGKQAGPVLNGIGSRVTRDYLLESLLTPSKVIAPGFQNVSIETNDGESYDGVITSEDNRTLTIALTAGGTKTLTKDSVFSRSASSVSAMPSMAGMINPFEMRDLVAYLSSLKD